MRGADRLKLTLIWRIVVYRCRFCSLNVFALKTSDVPDAPQVDGKDGTPDGTWSPAVF